MTETSTGPALGVNVAGFLRSGLGLGEAARLYVAALRAAGVPVRTTTVDVPLPQAAGRNRPSPKRAEFSDLETDEPTPFNMVCVNADELPRFRADVGEEFFAGRRSIGVWAWEVDKVPAAWAGAFGLVDEIWVYSHYVAEIISRAALVPVIRVPLPVIPPEPRGPAPDLRLPERFTFLFLYDFWSTMQRKNPLGLIEAFKRAFRPGEAQLLVKSFNGDYHPDKLSRVERAAAGHPDVHVVDRYLTLDEKNALMAACDCYVSLHRAEGFGLTLGEAMALGKPVVATGFSGNTDFMTPRNSWLVDYELAPVGPEGGNYPADGTWAEPDLDHAAALMRQVFDDRDAARERAEHGRSTVLEELSPEAVGALARARLERLARAPSSPPSAGGTDSPAGNGSAAAVEDAALKAEQKLSFDPLRHAAEEGGATGLFRQSALRAMRPYTYHQDELNERVVHAIRALADRIAWLERETGLAHPLMRGALYRLLQGIHARPAETHPFISKRDQFGRPVLEFTADHAGADEGYSTFEDVFRGSERIIRERQRAYADLLRGHSTVFDLGCGRGEFLDLLREKGIDCEGVDLDQDMVRRSRQKGHHVTHADAVEWLREREERSLPAVFASQFVEHLGPQALQEFLSLLATRLEPGGVAVLETMNPHSPWALKAFWTDPTHHHPLFPEVLLALCRIAGFAGGRVMFPGGEGDLERDVYACHDYAVVARAAPAG